MSHLTIRLAVAAGRIANYCDHLEHAEEVEREWAVGGATEFRYVAWLLAVDVFDLHDEFTGFIDARSDLHRSDRARQLALVEFDRAGDEVSVALGRSRYDQLRSQAICASILVGEMADPKVKARVLAVHLLLCGLRIATIMHEKLDDSKA